VGGWVARLTGKPSALNMDKFNILRQRNWRCDIQPAIDDLGYQPRYTLEMGVSETVAWYKQQGWL
jgi:nucleoside-diphosphate-sugar epimerase